MKIFHISSKTMSSIPWGIIFETVFFFSFFYKIFHRDSMGLVSGLLKGYFCIDMLCFFNYLIKILICDSLHYLDAKQNDQHENYFQQLSIVFLQEYNHKHLNSMFYSIKTYFLCYECTTIRNLTNDFRNYFWYLFISFSSDSLSNIVSKTI